MNNPNGPSIEEIGEWNDTLRDEEEKRQRAELCVRFCAGLTSDKITLLLGKCATAKTAIDFADKYEAEVYNLRINLTAARTQLYEANDIIEKIEVNNPLIAHISERVKSLLDAHKEGTPLPDPIDCFTDNFGEVLEKLVILSIRVWFFEDQMGDAHMRGDDAKIAEIKKKMDILWKRKRPAIVAAINRMVDDAIVHGRSLREDSLKNYKGFE